MDRPSSDADDLVPRGLVAPDGVEHAVDIDSDDDQLLWRDRLAKPDAAQNSPAFVARSTILPPSRTGASHSFLLVYEQTQ